MDRLDEIRDEFERYTQTTIDIEIPAMRIMELEQENAKLKAKLHNIEEGVCRLGEFIAKENRTPELQNYMAFDFDREIYTLVRWDGAEMYAAPSMPDLIDAILTGGE